MNLRHFRASYVIWTIGLVAMLVLYSIVVFLFGSGVVQHQPPPVPHADVFFILSIGFILTGFSNLLIFYISITSHQRNYSRSLNATSVMTALFITALVCFHGFIQGLSKPTTMMMILLALHLFVSWNQRKQIAEIRQSKTISTMNTNVIDQFLEN